MPIYCRCTRIRKAKPRSKRREKKRFEGIKCTCVFNGKHKIAKKVELVEHIA